MELINIQNNVAALNASTRKSVKKTAPKKPAAPTVPPVNLDEILRVNATRICNAFGMVARGVTPDILVAGVKQYEENQRRMVQ